MAESELQFEGKTYVPSKIAAAETGYAQDYIGQLARGGNIHAKRVGGLWYVELESVQKHKAESEAYIPEASRGAVGASGASVVFEDVEYVSSKHAAQITDYAQDYVGQLARSGKIRSRQVGGRWYVSKDDLRVHKREKDGLLAAVQAEAMGLRAGGRDQVVGVSEGKHKEEGGINAENGTGREGMGRAVVSSIQPLRRLHKEQALLTYLSSDGEVLPSIAEKQPRYTEKEQNTSAISDYRSSEQRNNKESRNEEAGDIEVNRIAIRAMKHDTAATVPHDDQERVGLYGYSSQGAHNRHSVHTSASRKRKNKQGMLLLGVFFLILLLATGSAYAIFEYAPDSSTAGALRSSLEAVYSVYEGFLDAVVPGIEYSRTNNL